MKKAALYFFEDEPQFATYESRNWTAHYLRSCRNSKGNLNCKRFDVKRTGFGRYSVQLRYSGSPVAVIVTH